MSYLANLKSGSLIHFSGIGGIGMSGIAEILHTLGYKLQGSDISENGNTQRLSNLGINVFLGQDPKNLQNIGLLVRSSAIKADNPEVLYCKSHNIPVISRTEMLAELMALKTSVSISGTHGKTTTTSLVASIFEKANLSPTVINGGIINTKGTNAYIGKGEYLITEADESDATFIKIPSTIAVITNIDPEHLDYYGTFAELKKAFKTFITNLPFYGFGILCIDHPEVRKLSKQIKDRKIITYGIKSEDADVYAHNIKQTTDGSKFDVKISKNLDTKLKTLKNIKLPIPGLHNVQNSLAAIAIAIQLNFPKEVICNGFSEFNGVKRRFTKVGVVKGVTIVDDYAHHPAEVKATLETARQATNVKKGKIIAVFQPHRYTRLRDLFKEFSQAFWQADKLYISDVYSAQEAPIPGVNKEELVQAIKKQKSNFPVLSLNSKDDLVEIIKKDCKKNDILLFMGAGDITKWAYELPEKLKSNV